MWLKCALPVEYSFDPSALLIPRQYRSRAMASRQLGLRLMSLSSHKLTTLSDEWSHNELHSRWSLAFQLRYKLLIATECILVNRSILDRRTVQWWMLNCRSLNWKMCKRDVEKIKIHLREGKFTGIFLNWNIMENET